MVEQVLNIDESKYEDDEDMLYLISRLRSAASDSKVRQDMNVEDEYFLAIESRDTEIMRRDQRILKMEKELAAKQDELAAKESLIEKMVLAMAANGMSAEVIAQSVGMDISKVKILIDK